MREVLVGLTVNEAAALVALAAMYERRRQTYVEDDGYHGLPGVPASRLLPRAAAKLTKALQVV